MSNNKNLPILISDLRKSQLERVARITAKNYMERVYPILLDFGLLNEAHIKKYLTSTTMEDIYQDALKENPEKMRFLGQMEYLDEVDVWAKIRATDSPVKNPGEEGFIFAPLPCTDSPLHKTATKALFVENGKVYVNYIIIDEESIVKPTDKQQELYEIVANFCEALKEKGFHKRVASTLIINTPDGVKPSIEGIMGSVWYSIKKK